MKIILSKPNQATEEHLKDSIDSGLKEIRLDCQNDDDFTLQGDNKTLTVIIHNNIERNKKWLLNVANNYCIPYQMI